jgi:hypothetical protein
MARPARRFEPEARKSDRHTKDANPFCSRDTSSHGTTLGDTRVEVKARLD